MSFRTLSLLHTVLCNVQAALAVGAKVDAGIFGDFNAGVAPLALSGREPSDMELSALTQLGDAVTASAGASAAVGEEGDAPASPAQVTEPDAGEPAPSEPAAETAGVSAEPAADDDSDGA